MVFKTPTPISPRFKICFTRVPVSVSFLTDSVTYRIHNGGRWREDWCHHRIEAGLPRASSSRTENPTTNSSAVVLTENGILRIALESIKSANTSSKKLVQPRLDGLGTSLFLASHHSEYFVFHR